MGNGNSTGIIILVMAMVMIMVCSASASSAFYLFDPLGIFGTTSGLVSGTGTEGSAGTPTDCIAVKDQECAGKKGKDRNTCIKESKKRCLAAGGVWNSSGSSTSSGGTTVTDSKTGDSVGVPEVAKYHTSEDCVYFYDTDGKQFSSDVNVKGWGYHCLGDTVGDEYSDAIGPWAMSKQSNMDKNKTDFIKVGKNVNVNLWTDIQMKGKKFEGKGSSLVLKGSDYGVNKIIDLDNTSVKRNNIDLFRIDRA